MKKIISLFQRNHDGDRLVRDEVTPGAEWVVAGEGVATRKFDGTCCLARGGRLFKRHDVKKGKTPPPGFEPAQDADPTTGHWPGWVPVGDGPEDRYHREAWSEWSSDGAPDGTYELCGPKVNGNPESYHAHGLVRHGRVEFPDCPRTFEDLRIWLDGRDIEGVVWHHPDGRMAKVKAKDFGIWRKAPPSR